MPIQLTVEQRAELQSKVDWLEDAVRTLKARRGEDDLVADVEIYEKTGKWPLEFPEDFMNMQDVAYTLTVLDRGVERARLLWNGQAPWTKQKGRKIYGMYSALDGPVQPYGVNVPDSYDGSKLVRLYVWLHGRNAGLSEGNFIYTFTGAPPSQASTMNSANVGQIQLDVYGRWTNGYNWASEVDVAEAIAAVKRALSGVITEPRPIDDQGRLPVGRNPRLHGFHYLAIQEAIVGSQESAASFQSVGRARR